MKKKTKMDYIKYPTRYPRLFIPNRKSPTIMLDNRYDWFWIVQWFDIVIKDNVFNCDTRSNITNTFDSWSAYWLPKKNECLLNERKNITNDNDNLNDKNAMTALSLLNDAQMSSRFEFNQS